MNTAAREYTTKATEFLSKHKLTFQARFKNTDCPPYCTDDKHTHGHQYLITLARAGESGRLSFSFWNSYADMCKMIKPSAYSVLACLSSDIYCPDTFADFCSDYGYDQDSRKALRTFKRCKRFASKLRAFFSNQELLDLTEIK